MSTKARKPSLVSGILTINSRGFGFVIDPSGVDLFIPYDNLGTGLNGDTVKAERLQEVPGRNPIGRVVKVVKRAGGEIVGIFRIRDGGNVVVPEDDRMKRPLIIGRGMERPNRRSPAARDGQVVAARLVRWDDPRQEPTGAVVEVLGYPTDPGIELRIIARAAGLAREFPAAVQTQVARMRPFDPAAELHSRKDLRDLHCLTIDPQTAEDFDDAVSLRQLPSGLFELGVHIADVSYYVRENSPLDKEARARTTSVYFVSEVIPMLPERLSNSLCSLVPGEDRPAFSVLMRIDGRGEVRDYSIEESIIRSRRRFTYEEAEAILGGAQDPHSRDLHLMLLLSIVLRRKREEIGSIDFDIPTPVISLDAEGIPHEVRPSQRLDAHRLVEEFMLIANRTVARHIQSLDRGAARNERGRTSDRPAWPFIYRIHESPDEEDMVAFLKLLEGLGIRYNIQGDLAPEDYRKILDIIENLEFKEMVEKVALRSMSKAIYSTRNSGHFGLAFDAYTHFTSPIRRYADLIVHRLLKQYASRGKPRAAAGLENSLAAVCAECSAGELRANEAEREYSRLKSMEFLKRRIGESFDGLITGVASFGLFVEITHYLIEGLVHVSEMKDDRYIYDKEAYQLRGERSGRIYRLGDPVRVRIKQVSPEERKADFTLLATASRGRQSGDT